MLIIEGADHSGKTTLAKMIGQTQNLEVRHSPSEAIREGKWDQAILWLEEQFLENERVVYDRFPVISEQIYGPILRGQDILEGSGFMEQLFSADHLIIYCRPRSDFILNHYTTSQPPDVKEHKIALLAAYDRVMGEMGMLGFNVITYDFKHHCFPAEEVINHMRGMGW